jgi:hypothetical protein
MKFPTTIPSNKQRAALSAHAASIAAPTYARLAGDGN